MVHFRSEFRHLTDIIVMSIYIFIETSPEHVYTNVTTEQEIHNTIQYTGERRYCQCRLDFLLDLLLCGLLLRLRFLFLELLLGDFDRDLCLRVHNKCSNRD